MIGISSGSRRAAIAEPILRQLAAGVRASKRRVGYLGSEAALTVLNNGDPLPGGWNASWQSGALVINAANVTLDHYRINGCLVFQGSSPTVTNCKIYSNPGSFYGIALNGGGAGGVLTVTDTTVVGDPSSGSAQVNGISSDSGLVARRCDVSHTGDGVHMVAQPNQADAIISQCYVHNLAYIDEAQHCDGVQIFNNSVSNGYFTVEHCSVPQSLSTIGTPMNSAMTCGTPSGDPSMVSTPIVNNNYFEGGAYHLRLNFRLHNATVTNNDLGPLVSGEFGTVSADSPMAIWSNNRDSNGSQIANPSPLTTPTVKEVLQTSDGVTTTQTISTTAGNTAAGDTLLVIYATDRNTAPAPTSTAGTLTQIGTTITGGDGTGLLQAYTVPVSSSGSKDVTIPAAGVFDIFGVVAVISGSVEVEGFTKTSFVSSNTSFTTPAATVAGSKDLLVAIAINLQGNTFDLSSSGLSQRGNPKALPFSAVVAGTAALSASGTTPTYTFTTSAASKPGVGVFALQTIAP
ncbi:MAG TPA: hypothetical protein VLF59_02095 [Candidatus Saccharimonadales bacterium]|nr:hypothetical protein [Candidatus Saccharimonadales bacterium]